MCYMIEVEITKFSYAKIVISIYSYLKTIIYFSLRPLRLCASLSRVSRETGKKAGSRECGKRIFQAKILIIKFTQDYSK